MRGLGTAVWAGLQGPLAVAAKPPPSSAAAPPAAPNKPCGCKKQHRQRSPL